jgi:hypothetical protein
MKGPPIMIAEFTLVVPVVALALAAVRNPGLRFAAPAEG